jgi:hypothetical protein
MKSINTSSCKHCKASLITTRVDAIYCSKRCRLLALKKRKREATCFVYKKVKFVCVECKQEYIATRPQQEYCSSTCQKIAYARERATPLTVRNCIICSIEFMPNSAMHTLCSDKCIDIRNRNNYLARKYGLTLETFEELLKKQGGGCAICKTKDTTNLVVDHDHTCCVGKENTCGKCVRGILCWHCNAALGLFKDSQKIVEQAAAYLTGSNKVGQKGSVYGGLKD